jgi:hypothetical protein
MKKERGMRKGNYFGLKKEIAAGVYRARAANKN